MAPAEKATTKIKARLLLRIQDLPQGVENRVIDITGHSGTSIAASAAVVKKPCLAVFPRGFRCVVQNA
jgi:hypothetical protein